MTWKYRFLGGVAVLLACAIAVQAQGVPQPPPNIPAPAISPGGAVAAQAQAVPQPPLEVPVPVVDESQVPPRDLATGSGLAVSGPDNGEGGAPFVAGSIAEEAVTGLEAESLPRELAEDVSSSPRLPTLGPTPVSEVRFLMDTLGAARLFGDSGIRTFGWLEGGYTYASTGPGLLSVETRQNRFGDEFLLNQLGLVIQKPLKEDQFDIGFNVRYFAGADAALGAPKGGIDFPPGNPRFGQDFRDLYLDAHLPVLTEGGMDVRVGRMNTIIGYNGFLAPYRPFYSSDYQFFYSQDGAFTGVLTDLHVSKRMDVWNGITLGANTFFTLRSNNSYCYIGQINYWLQDEHKTRLTGSVYAGPNALFAAPGLAGTFDTMVELRIQHSWSQRLTQVVQSNMGWDPNSVVGTGSWYGLYSIGILHLNARWDLLGRVEWFDDVNGTRTGINTSFEAVTLGFNWHPNKYLEVRPEIRGDFAGKPAFHGGFTNNPVFTEEGGGIPKDRSQLTMAMSALLKF